MNSPFPYNYICIEGNIGAGKTTFCKKIQTDFECNLILEQFDDNPFLPLFYKEPERFAFTVELFFMTERYKQMQANLLNQNLFSQFTISDYAFVKTLLFAKKNLVEEEFRLFQNLYHVFDQTFPKPDLLVYFHRNVNVLQEKIKKRGRVYETEISDDYLLQVQNAYFEYFRNILSYPVLIIDVDMLDFENNNVHYEQLKYLLTKKYNPGVHRISLVI
ncbi:MAG: deoxynucleoside kinase [Saprospiraceae bacterium]|nr:deoxynucleoside kinase [Saprospiraceae bacterium]MBK6784838.1 deoxynucleoside kinase [Saprospiraceae bacterium]MBK8081304.1 deoxynucleoside kinase [Saprospiraceae bacterium]MBK8370087.1 deoxynucleoside kinase [Saprospiraceae bacterium]MBK8546902.1 deoxynucleoside kinase [Saprospiraceae bacterium]